MKPKNSLFCNGAKRPKIRFESQKSAETFIRFNGEAIEQGSGKAPKRAYFCRWCVAWHTTSHSRIGRYESDRLFDEVTTKKAITKKADKPKFKNPYITEIERDVSGMLDEKRKEYFESSIAKCKAEISRNKDNKDNKWLLDALFLTRIKFGLKPDAIKEDQFDGYKKWFDEIK